MSNQILPLLSYTSSKPNAVSVSKIIGEDQKLLNQLIEIILGDEFVYAQRVSHTLIHTIEINSLTLTDSQLCLLIDNLINREDQHPGVARNVLRSMHFSSTFPESKSAQLYDYCLHKIGNPTYPIAVQAFAINVAYTIALPFKELQEELLSALELAKESDSTGLRSRIVVFIKKIRKNIKS